MNEFAAEIIAMFSYFAYVALKSVQQRNVAWLRYLTVMPIGYAIAVAEVLVISTISYKAYTVFPPTWYSIIELMPMMFAIGTGGGGGAALGMFLHHKYIGETKR